MPVNSASRSIGFPDSLAENHNVQFVVHSRLIVPDVEQLNEHPGDHLRFMKSLSDKGMLPISGPFFTRDGENTGNGFYVLRVENLEEARRLTAQDPLHKEGIGTPRVNPGCRSLLDPHCLLHDIQITRRRRDPFCGRAAQGS